MSAAPFDPASITPAVVARLITEQFPAWGDLPVRPVETPGHDNRTFHLGDALLVRLPSGPGYAPQIAREQAWLPSLAERVRLPISVPVAHGRASRAYPFDFTVTRYLPGEPATREGVADLRRFARDLAAFLREWQAIDALGGPRPSADNCYRGAPLTVYDAETRRALADLADDLDAWDQTPAHAPGELRGRAWLEHLWDEALASPWTRTGVWVHGDIAPGNLLVRDGVLCGVIDFGCLAVGDPACDYAIAWTFLDAPARRVFAAELALDAASLARGRAWALWKALITYRSEEPGRAGNARVVLAEILRERDAIRRTAPDGGAVN